jgi:hypothetical protein
LASALIRAVQESALPATLKPVAIAVVSHAGASDRPDAYHVWPSIERLCYLSGRTLNTVKWARRELVALGVLTQPRGTTYWVIHPEALPTRAPYTPGAAFHGRRRTEAWRKRRQRRFVAAQTDLDLNAVTETGRQTEGSKIDPSTLSLHHSHESKIDPSTLSLHHSQEGSNFDPSIAQTEGSILDDGGIKFRSTEGSIFGRHQEGSLEGTNSEGKITGAAAPEEHHRSASGCTPDKNPIPDPASEHQSSITPPGVLARTAENVVLPRSQGGISENPYPDVPLESRIVLGGVMPDQHSDPEPPAPATPDSHDDEDRLRWERYQKLLDQIKAIGAKPPLEKRQRRA